MNPLSDFTTTLSSLTSSRLHRFLFPVGLAWGCGSGLALKVCTYYFDSDLVPIDNARSLAFGLLSILLAEILAMTLLLSSCKTILLNGHSRFRRLSAGAILFVSWIGLVALGFLSLVGWTLRFRGNDFLTFGSLAATAVDWSSIYPYLSTWERVTLTIALAVSFLVSTVVVAKSPCITKRQALTLLATLVYGVSAAILFLRAAPSTFAYRFDADVIYGTVNARLTPTTTLLWAPLLISDSTANDSVTIPLARQESFDMYARKVDRSAKRPNIIIFALESLRGHAVTHVVDGREVMPTVRRLAQMGVNFTRAYAQANESAYSFHSIISGLFPLKRPRRDLFRTFDYPLLRISDLLSPAYRTAHISSVDERWQGMFRTSFSPRLDKFADATTYSGKVTAPDPSDVGFYRAMQSVRLKTGALDDSVSTRILNEWIQSKAASADGRPFEAMVYYHTSHFPYEMGANVPAYFTPNVLTPEERGDISFIYYPESLTSRMLNRYWNSLHYIDSLIASTLETLKQCGQLDNTIIVVVGDHGELFHENGQVTHAAKLFDKTLHVSFVISGATTPAIGDTDELVSLIDLGPALLHLADMPPYSGFQGTVPRSLKTRSTGRADQPVPVFSTVQNISYEDSVMVGHWKYVEQANHAYNRLLNLETDPLEKINVQDRPRIKECLAETLHEFRRNQFAYYADATLKKQYFAPRHRLARIPACSQIFDR